MLRERSSRSRVALGLLVAAALAAGCRQDPGPRLLLLITVDTLRADELGAYGSERGLTPHLDALAAESLVFERAYAPASFTLPSIATVLTGRYPEELGIRDNESGLPPAVPTLAGELSGRGWRTAAVVGNFVLRRASGVARGFERFDDAFGQVEAVRRWPERIAADTTEAALAQLADCTAGTSSRCFLWVHYQDPHGPYDPPGQRRAALLDDERAGADGRRELLIGEDHLGFGAIPAYQALEGRRDVAWYRAGYRAEIQYMDEQLGRLLAAVDAAGLRDRALVAVAADHGESLGEDDVWFAHGTRLDDAQARVPLLLRAPGLAPGRRGDVVSLRDLYPTLLQRLAGTAPRGAGRDLLAPDAAERDSEPYLSTLGAAPQRRYAIVADGYKLVVAEREGVFDSRLYRLGREDVDLSPAAPQVAAALRERLDRLRGGLVRGDEVPQALSDGDREQLRALGDLEPEAEAGGRVDAEPEAEAGGRVEAEGPLEPAERSR
jgi:arylsulfatase